jgi:hypothetical protein
MGFTAADLHVVAAITNPERYRTRYDLYRRFADHVVKAGARLTTVEAAFGDRVHRISDDPRVTNIQLRTSSEIWLKENLINIGISRLPADWEYVAWVDADVAFARPDWAEETVHQLQHFAVVQMFSTAQDLSPSYVPFQTHKGFMFQYHQALTHPGQPLRPCTPYTPEKCHMDETVAEAYQRGARTRYEFWHPGFAWAARREAINDVGQLIDWALLGAADHHMALGLVGSAHLSLPGGISAGYRDGVMRWQEKAEEHIRRNVGYVDGMLNHYWHGKKRDRRYIERWDILIRNAFDPHTDLKRDHQGLWQLAGNKIRLRDDLRHYFRARNEDSIDPE